MHICKYIASLFVPVATCKLTKNNVTANKFKLIFDDAGSLQNLRFQKGYFLLLNKSIAVLFSKVNRLSKMGTVGYVGSRVLLFRSTDAQMLYYSIVC